MHATADRGGPFGRDTDIALARAEREGAAPGTEFRFASTAESSPIRSRARPRRSRAASDRADARGGLPCDRGLACGRCGLRSREGVARPAAAARSPGTRRSAGGGAVKPWPWADTHPVARLIVPAHRVELLVLAGANGRTLAWGPGHVEGTRGARRAWQRGGDRASRHPFRVSCATSSPATGSSSRRRRAARVAIASSAASIADHRALKLPADDRSTTLALVTCYPFDAVDPGTPLRYAVIARGE